VRRIWPEVLEVVKQASRRTRALLDNAQVAAVSGETLHLTAPAALARMIADDSNTELVKQALTRVVGGAWQVAVTPENGGAPSRPDRPAARPPEPDPRDDVDPDDGDAPSAPREVVDPETAALRLLQDQLGARPVEDA
jgi:DNA polymerase-3 subunit gamma/tau